MTDTRTEERAALYVLDLLEEPERSTFEAQLAASGDLQKLVRELSAGLHGRLRHGDGPARMELLPRIHLALGEGEETAARDGIRPARKPVLPWAGIWAVAAGIMLLLNLGLLMIVNNPSAPAFPSPPGEGVAAAGAGQGATAAALQQTNAQLQARITRLQDQLEDREKELARIEDNWTRLEEENREVKQYNSGWQREYMKLAARFLPFFESNDGMSRFTVIEMVDANAYNNQLPRRGFADLAGSFLSGRGNIAGTGSPDFVGPVVEGAAYSSQEGEADSSLAAVSREQARQVSGSEGIVSPEEPQAPLIGADGEAVGFTVWRDDEQKGFLDIYNLPETGNGQEPFLWVRSSNLEPYKPVGFLPELDNGTGSFFYSVDEPNFTPTEIMITSEDSLQVGSDPSGDVLLRGP